MGTRNFIGVRKSGQLRVAQYNQWDGYPSGQGAGILTFLREHGLRGLEKNLPRCKFLTAQELTQAQNDIDAGRKTLSGDFPLFSRDHGSNILEMIALAEGDEPLLLRDSSEFPADSLFCEYAYVLDLDTEELEFFEGFNKVPLTAEEPFYELDQKRIHNQLKSATPAEYCAVRLVKRYSLWDLPENSSVLEKDLAEFRGEELAEEGAE